MQNFMLWTIVGLAACAGSGGLSDDGGDGITDGGSPIDLDGDGFANEADCAPEDETVHPAAAEIPYDGVDNDCNVDTYDDDLDQDGFLQADDCDDENGDVNPGKKEVPYDGLDNDCSEQTDDYCVPIDICDANGCVLDFAVQTATLSGSVLYDAEPIANRQGDDWMLRVTDTESGTVRSVYVTSDPTRYEIDLYEGVYDVQFALLNGGVQRPVEGYVTVGANVVITGDTTLDFELETSTFTGTATWNGEPIANREGSEFQLRFTDLEDGTVRTFSVDNPSETFEGDLYAGTYDVVFDLTNTAVVDTPIDQFASVNPAFDLITDNHIDIDVVTTTLSGAPPVYDGDELANHPAYDEWQLMLTNVTTGWTRYEYLQGAEWEVDVFPGTYAVGFSLHDAQVDRPVNGRVTVDGALAITGPTTLDIDVAPVQLSGAISYDGEPIRSFESGFSLKTIDSTGTTQSHSFEGVTDAWELFVWPGTYDLIFELGNAMVTNEVSGWHRVAENLNVNHDAVFDIALNTHQITGGVTYNGEPMQANPFEDDFRMYLSNHQSGYSRSLYLDLEDDRYETYAFTGNYDVSFEVTGGRAIEQAHAGLYRFAEDAPLDQDVVLNFDIYTMPLSGVVTYDGAVIPHMPQNQDFHIGLTEVASGHYVSLESSTGDSDFGDYVYPGVYRVKFNLDSGRVDTVVDGDVLVAQCVRIE